MPNDTKKQPIKKVGSPLILCYLDFYRISFYVIVKNISVVNLILD